MSNRKIFANQGPTKPDNPKSTFDLSHSNNLTCRFGRMYPIFLYEAPAGTSIRIKPYTAFDFHPMAFPIQTNVRCHMSFFKVPLRILWRHYKEFIGQHDGNGQVATSATQYVVPTIARPEDWHGVGSLADYMGLPSIAISRAQNASTAPASRVYSPAFHVYNDHPVYPITINELSPNRFEFQYYTLRIKSGVTDIEYNSSVLFAPISNFKGDYLEFNFCHSDSGLSSTDLADSSSVLGTNKMCILCGAFNKNPKQYLINDRTDLIQPLLSSDISLTLNHTMGGLSYYTCRISLNSAISSYMEYQSAAGLLGCFQLLYSNSVLPVTDQVSSNDASLVDLDNKDDSINGIISTVRTAFYGGLSYPAVSVVGQDSKYMFRTNSDGINGGKPYLPISALPFRAYEFIQNYFFRNERVTPFTPNGQPVFNEFITNDGDGEDSTTPVHWKDVLNAPYEYDLFTTCVKTPQFGNAPLVGITTNDDQTANLLMRNISVSNPDGSDVTTRNIGVRLDENNKIVGISNYEEVADMPSVARLQEAIKFGISINDFRNVNALQRFQERYLKAGTKYQNIVYEFFGTNPPIGEEFPEYIGGDTSMLNVSKVVSTADTGDKGLGGFVGQASLNSKGSSIRCFCAEQSYIIGIMYFTVTPTYSQMLPRHFTKSKLLDFQNPQFNNLSLQPVYTHQLAPLQLEGSEVGEVFGYNRPYAEYVSMQDEVHGDFRTSMSNYLLQRIFASKPELSKDFLYINPEDLTDVFINTDDDDKIFGQIYFDCRAKLPLPRFAVPRII